MPKRARKCSLVYRFSFHLIDERLQITKLFLKPLKVQNENYIARKNQEVSLCYLVNVISRHDCVIQRV